MSARFALTGSSFGGILLHRMSRRMTRRGSSGGVPMATVKKVRKSVAPYYGVAATWVIYALLFDLYKVSNFVFAGLLSAGMFLLLRAVCKDETYEVEVPDPKPEPVSTGSAELDKMLQDGARAISEMKRLDDNIADEKISADIRRLETVSQSIFDQVKAQPAKLPQIRKFMDYYLPTTLKLLNAYDRMSAAGVSGENIDTTKTRVEGMMDTIVSAFEKQLDSLFGEDALDISTDISVLETMMAREGLAGDQMEAETTRNADGTDIRLEL